MMVGRGCGCGSSGSVGQILCKIRPGQEVSCGKETTSAATATAAATNQIWCQIDGAGQRMMVAVGMLLLLQMLLVLLVLVLLLLDGGRSGGGCGGQIALMRMRVQMLRGCSLLSSRI